MDSQREEAIEGKLRECREYADRIDMTVVGNYIDRAAGGGVFHIASGKEGFRQCHYRSCETI